MTAGSSTGPHRTRAARALVVGAGMSGLAAAWELRRLGADVTVLERADRAGGRVHSVRVNDCVIEAGANFLTSAYQVVPRLARDVGLRPRVITGGAAVVISGRLHSYRLESPSTVVRSGLLPAGGPWLRSLAYAGTDGWPQEEARSTHWTGGTSTT